MEKPHQAPLEEGVVLSDSAEMPLLLYPGLSSRAIVSRIPLTVEPLASR